MNTFRQVGIFLISFGFISILLTTPPNANITAQYYEMGFEKIIFLICIFTLLMGLKGLWGHTIGLTAVLSLFLLSLIYKWQTADNFLLLGGLFPQRDALAYYQDAQRLMHGFYMIGSGTYRPIHSSFLAVLMKMTNSNLQLILIILVICNALAVYFAAQEIRKVLKSNFASAIYIILAYMFFRRFSGTLLTENLGFCLGNLAMIFLIRGSFLNRFDQILYGIFLLTIALNTRAGAFLILPVLTIWLGMSFLKVQGFWRPFILGCFVISLGMVANFIVAKVTTAPKSKTFSNYSYTLYGLASGNKSWEQARKDYPNADTDQIYSLAFHKIINDPALFLRGILGAYRDYFESSNGAFSFLLLKHDRGDIANLILWFLTFVGLIAAYIHRKEKAYSIIIVFFLGIFISISLVPPADSQKMRVYAATIPLTSYIIVTGIVSIRNLLKNKDTLNSIINPVESHWALATSILMLTTCLILPVFVKWIGNPINPEPTVSCRYDKKVFTLSIARGSSIKLGININKSYIPNLDISQFAKKTSRPEHPMPEEDKPFFLGLPPGTIITLVWGTEKHDGDKMNPPGAVSLITTDLPKAGSYTLCVTPTPVDSFYYADLNDNQKADFPVSYGERFGLNGFFRAVQISVLVIVFLFILFDFSQIQNLPHSKVLIGSANIIMLCASIFFFMHHFGIIPLATERQSIDASQIRNSGDNYLYTVNIGTNKISDTLFRDFSGSLYEDGVLLEPPHESQSLINIYGGGGYILRGNLLFFSTSDNSDPRTNGREYILTWPVRARLRYQFIALAAFLLSLVTHNKFIEPNKNKP